MIDDMKLRILNLVWQMCIPVFLCPLEDSQGLLCFALVHLSVHLFILRTICVINSSQIFQTISLKLCTYIISILKMFIWYFADDTIIFHKVSIFSSPGRSPGRAIVLPTVSALALAKCLAFKFFMWWARRCQASYPVPVIGLVDIDNFEVSL